MDRIETEIMGMAIRAGIRPNWSAIAERAGVTGQTVRRAFRRGEVVSSTTLQYIAEALEVPIGEVRRLHATAQLDAPPQSNGAAAAPAPPPPAQRAETAKVVPRDLWSELTKAALTGETVIVSAHSDDRGFSVARGLVVGLHEGLVAIHVVGDQRPVRIRREHVKDVCVVAARAGKAE